MAQPDLVPITVYLVPGDKAILEEMAKENDRNISAEARRIIVPAVRAWVRDRGARE